MPRLSNICLCAMERRGRHRTAEGGKGVKRVENMEARDWNMEARDWKAHLDKDNETQATPVSIAERRSQQRSGASEKKQHLYIHRLHTRSCFKNA
eukprot:c11801_g1_i2 orf=162-446(-)